MTDKPCICSWKDCKTLHLNIWQITPASHVWNQPIIRLQFPKTSTQSLSLKKYALQQTILRHLSIDKSRHLCLKNIFIAPHHFPISLLEWRRRNGINTFTKYLSPSDLGNMRCIDNVYESFREKSNSVVTYLRSHDRTNSNSKYTKCYLQSPLETRSVVQSFLKSENRMKNSSSRALCRFTDTPDMNYTSPLPSTNVATIDTPINDTVGHDNDYT